MQRHRADERGEEQPRIERAGEGRKRPTRRHGYGGRGERERPRDLPQAAEAISRILREGLALGFERRDDRRRRIGDTAVLLTCGDRRRSKREESEVLRHEAKPPESCR